MFSANSFPHTARAELCFHKPLIDFQNWSTLRKEVWFYCCTNCCRLIYNILFNSCVFTRYFRHSYIFGLCWRSSSAVLAYNFDKYAKYLELNDKKLWLLMALSSPWQSCFSACTESKNDIHMFEWVHNSRLNKIKIDKRPSGCWGSVLDFFCVSRYIILHPVVIFCPWNHMRALNWPFAILLLSEVLPPKAIWLFQI